MILSNNLILDTDSKLGGVENKPVEPKQLWVQEKCTLCLGACG